VAPAEFRLRVRLQSEFVYLALILDGFSSKVVGWNLDRTLASRLAMDALGGGYRSAEPAATPGTSFRPWRLLGSTLPSYENTRSFQHEPASNPYDNASCESFIKTLKRGRDLRQPYQDLEHLRSNIEEFIERLQPETIALGLGLSFAKRVRARDAARKRDHNGWCYSTILTAERGESLPQTYPCRRINEMGFEGKQCRKV
jgi:hypothetical protein